MKIEVSLSPALYQYRVTQSHHTTVAVDVLRATTSICAALQAGCGSIVPVANLEDLKRYEEYGYSLAAERNGEKIGSAQYGNSPTEYLRNDMHGVKLAYSTTNGTVSVLMSADAELSIVGAFSNISAVARRIEADGRDVVVLCSGWESDFCIEDTLFAGALISRVAGAEPFGDAAMMAVELWKQACGDVRGYCNRASHVARLLALGSADDVDYAFKMDTCHVVPIYNNGVICAE